MVKQCFSILCSLVLGLVCCGVPIAMAESNHKAQAADGFDEMLSSYQYPFAVDTYRFVSQGTSLEMAYMYLEPKRSALPMQRAK